ncbi:MAG: poly-gamma-glutamate hydrolase family protein [Hyphomicrobium sp.]
MTDKYRSFAELKAHEEEGRDYQIIAKDRRSAVAVVAPHAGKIEPGCSAIARAIAGDDLSIYLFEGTSTKAKQAAPYHIGKVR